MMQTKGNSKVQNSADLSGTKVIELDSHEEDSHSSSGDNDDFMLQIEQQNNNKNMTGTN